MSENKTKQNETKSNGSKPVETDSGKDNPLYYEIPLSETETLDWLTAGLRGNRRSAVTAVTVRVKENRLVIGVLPERD